MSSCFACGSIASHRHHGGEPTCKACSSFFRRSVGNKRMYKCRSNTDKCNNREINKHGCQACRFYRCLDAGMDIELIPFPEMPHYSDGILAKLASFWNYNYIVRLQSLRQTGAKVQKSYFEFEKTIASCQGALYAEMNVMKAYFHNCDTLINMNQRFPIEENVRAAFLGAWIGVEMIYRTVKNQGFDNRRVYFPDNSYLPANEQSLLHYYNSFGILFSTEIVARRIYELKISEVEFAICSYLLLLKTTGSLDQSNASNCKKLIDRIFRELQVEYDYRDKFDPALRIGDLILTLDLILNVKTNVERLLTCLSLHEKNDSNFFSSKAVET
ncbi:hypothetical protein M3Y97_00115000 [Aphelenchoides bicaudatus]|nr:hypothetical protein M3Y97_00115000 [Aphelenchoides bicaudatus]